MMSVLEKIRAEIAEYKDDVEDARFVAESEVSDDRE